jgi:prepilin-type N-terminal cleavage/methylation domain-containing protein/prepilin-type processing-associated H-X9-DG protein
MAAPHATSRTVGCRRGLSLVELLVVIAIVSVLIGLILAAVQRVRATAARVRCADHLRQLGVALHGYHGAHGQLPPGMSYREEKDPQPFLSWLARLLPHVEQNALWQQTEEAFRQDRNFLTPAHAARGVVVPLFTCPADPRTATPSGKDITGHPVALTSYLGVEGQNAGLADGLLYLDSRHRLADATDGASNTLLVGERPPSADLNLGWWYAGWGQRKNGDAEFLLGTRTRCYNRFRASCDEGPYHFTPGKFDNPCDTFHFWSPHPGGAHFLFADGSVRFLRYSADPIMPALASRAGGEPVGLPD